MSHPKSLDDFKPGNWKPNVIGSPGEWSEFSIVHENHSHGFISCGWDGSEKLILFGHKIPDFLWDLATGFTKAAADAMTKATMNKLEAKEKGYEVIAASAFEVGLLQNGKGIRTWFCQDFDRKLPDLDHPLIQEAIDINESFTPASESRSEPHSSPAE